MQSILYHDGNRQLQDEFESRRIADRLEEKLARTVFTDDDVAFIESRTFFFLATADAGWTPGLLVQGVACRAWYGRSDPPSSPSRIMTGTACSRASATSWENPAVGLLFLDFEKPRRLKNGKRPR